MCLICKSQYYRVVCLQTAIRKILIKGMTARRMKFKLCNFVAYLFLVTFRVIQNSHKKEVFTY